MEIKKFLATLKLKLVLMMMSALINNQLHELIIWQYKLHDSLLNKLGTNYS